MLINLRNALMTGKRLPYDAEVEYLESSGTQYINTNTIDDPANNIAQITFSIPTSTGASMSLFGSSGARFNYVSARWGSNRYNLGPSATTTPVLPISVGDVHVGTYTLTNNALTYTLDGVSAVYSSSLVFNNLPFAIFGIYGRPDASPFIGRVYGFKVIRKSDGTVIADYIPVRKGTVGYLYDRVSGRLFGNDGTGDFVLGPDVVPVEYIESHGTEWIDTGVPATGATDSEFQFKMSVVGFAFGARTAWNASAYSLNCAAENYAFNYGNNGVVADLKTSIRIDTNWHTAKIQSGGVLSLDEWTSTAGTFSFTTNGSLILFGTRQGSSLNLTASGFKYCKISDNGVLVRSFRPVRVGTEGAMMDVLTRRVYRNAGTGAFGYGNDLKYPIPSE